MGNEGKMAEGVAVKPVTLVGRAYVRDAENNDCVLCIDSVEVKGIVFGFFAPQDKENAQLAAAALNLWAGFDADGKAQSTLIITN